METGEEMWTSSYQGQVKRRRDCNVTHKVTFSPSVPFLIHDNTMELIDKRLAGFLELALTWSLRSPRLLLLLVLLLSSGPFHPRVSAEESCRKVPLLMNIRYGNCAPKELLLLSCFGQCDSYRRVNRLFPEQLETSCRCCREMGRRRARTRLRCPSPQNPRMSVLRVVSLYLPRRCVCRPCSG